MSQSYYWRNQIPALIGLKERLARNIANEKRQGAYFDMVRANWMRSYQGADAALSAFAANPTARRVTITGLSAIDTSARPARNADGSAPTGGPVLSPSDPRLPHPDASDLALGPNLGGEDAVTDRPGSGGTGSSGIGLPILVGGGLLLFLLLKRRR